MPFDNPLLNPRLRDPMPMGGPGTMMPQQQTAAQPQMQQLVPQAGGGFMGKLSELSGPLLTLGPAIMAGKVPEGLAAFGQQLQQQRTRNATVDWLRRTRPDLAEAVAAGVPIADAFKLAQTTAEAPKTVKAFTPDGQETTLQWNGKEWTPLGGAKGVDPTEGLKPEVELSKAYRSEKDVEAYQEVRNGYEKVRTAAAQNSGPGDISLLVGYMKMLDPGSVVREGEFATAESAGGAARQYINLYNKLLTGERLTPEMRAEFVRAADAVYQETVGNLGPTNDAYSQRAQRYGVDPGFIVQPEEYKPIDFGNMQPGQKTEKSVGGKKIIIERVE